MMVLFGWDGFSPWLSDDCPMGSIDFTKSRCEGQAEGELFSKKARIKVCAVA
jgi:hypothetical protein